MDTEITGLRHGYLQVVFVNGRFGRLERHDVKRAEDLEREFAGRDAVA